MGVLPLQFDDGRDAAEHGIDGTEVFGIAGIAEGLTPGKVLTLIARKKDGKLVAVPARVRIDTPNELAYYKHGGILNYVLRQQLGSGTK
jgi:aconitate hydratase